MKVSEIINGYTNYIKSKRSDLPKEIVELGEKRFRYCATCTLFNGVICDPLKEGVNVETGAMTKGCGCIIKVKVLSELSNCPLNKW